MKLREKLFEEHVDRFIASEIPARAEKMALEMNYYFDFLLPRNPAAKHSSQANDITSFPKSGPFPAEESVKSSDFFEPPAERTFILQILTEVFERALKWRAEMYKRTNEDWYFNFAMFGDPYSKTELEALRVLKDGPGLLDPRGKKSIERDGNWKKAAQRDNGVILCHLPIIYRRCRTNAQQAFGEWKLVCKGIAVVRQDDS